MPRMRKSVKQKTSKRNFMKTIEVFEIDELSDDAKKRAIESLRDINVSHSWWELVYDKHKQIINDAGFINPELHFSGFWSQGDGACFDCDYVNIEQYAQTTNEKRVLALQKEEYIDFGVMKNGYANHYSHEKTRYTDWSANRTVSGVLKAVCDGLENKIENRRLELCRALYRDLEAEYSYLTSDELILEVIRDSDYHFLENGTLI